MEGGRDGRREGEREGEREVERQREGGSGIWTLGNAQHSNPHQYVLYSRLSEYPPYGRV